MEVKLDSKMIDQFMIAFYLNDVNLFKKCLSRCFKTSNWSRDDVVKLVFGFNAMGGVDTLFEQICDKYASNIIRWLDKGYLDYLSQFDENDVSYILCAMVECSDECISIIIRHMNPRHLASAFEDREILQTNSIALKAYLNHNDANEHLVITGLNSVAIVLSIMDNLEDDENADECYNYVNKCINPDKKYELAKIVADYGIDMLCPPCKRTNIALEHVINTTDFVQLRCIHYAIMRHDSIVDLLIECGLNANVAKIVGGYTFVEGSIWRSLLNSVVKCINGAEDKDLFEDYIENSKKLRHTMITMR